jgi:hypothetical protein
MNKPLTYEIIKHVFTNFGLVNYSDSNLNWKSLLTKEFLLRYKISLIDGKKEHTNKVWGCQQLIGAQQVTILVGDLSIENDLAFCLLVQLKDAPAYGLYFGTHEDDCLMACTVNNESWLQCNIHLQATFLAAMEHMKDVGFFWKKAENCEDQYELMLSFIKYYDSLLGENNEGQKD